MPSATSRNRRNGNTDFTDFTDKEDFSTQSRQVAKTQRRIELSAPSQCYLRKLCILRKVFHALFSLFAPVHVVWLRLAALRLCAFAFKTAYPKVLESSQKCAIFSCRGGAAGMAKVEGMV
jgi:hypothetical protein